MSRDTLSGFFTGGAAAASMGFGPVGFIVGGAIGAIAGGKAEKRRRKGELKILKANTKQAFGIGEIAFGDISKARTDVAENYQSSISTARARFGASGAQLSGETWQAVQGSIAKERDLNTAVIDTRLDEFKNSEAYKFMEKDLSYMQETQQDQDTPGYNQGPTRYSVRTEGRSGETFFTDEQKDNLRSFTGDSPQGLAEFERYRDAVMPGQEDYMTARFGTDEAKKRFETEMTTRIERANEEYDFNLNARRETRLRQEQQDY